MFELQRERIKDGKFKVGDNGLVVICKEIKRGNLNMHILQLFIYEDDF